MHPDTIASLLEKHVPAQAIPYCLRLWQEYPFQLTLRGSRVTKIGDFTCRQGKNPRITINADSHPFQFLITYVHEVAHWRIHRVLGWKATPHGKEWKAAFKELCSPLLQLDIFPPELALALRQHLANPKASSFSDKQLSKVLRGLDSRLTGSTTLADIPEGSQFEIRGRWFTKGEHKRTRVVCRDLRSRRTYLIAADAVVGNR